MKLCDMYCRRFFDEARGMMANSMISDSLIAGHFAPELFAQMSNTRRTADVNRKRMTTAYDFKIDVWAVGVILYQLINHSHPVRL